MFSDLIPITKLAQKWQYWVIKAQNDPTIRAELNSMNTGNAIKRKFLYSYNNALKIISDLTPMTTIAHLGP